jgi:ABC-type transport system involved in multi-copper enzyme maturation permease subunit
MAAAFAFLGMLLLSMVVALLATLQLGDFFNANDEFGLVILTVVAFTFFALAVFAVTYALSRSASVIAGVALILAIVALAPVALPGLIQKIANRSTNPYTVGIENTAILIELVVPALIVVLVQWGLVRRRWLLNAGEEDLTHWPWVTTAIAGLVILNPFGLAFLQGTLKRSGGDFMWEFTATVTGVAVGVLLVMAWVECYIRNRILRRRLAETEPPESGGVKAQS